MKTETKVLPVETVKQYIKLMRVSHYIKNLLVFLPLFFSGQIFEGRKFLVNLLVFFALSAVSSIVYIINDIFDRERDRKHPTKCKRPIAAGTISVKAAMCFAGFLFVVAVVCNGVVFNWKVSAIMLAYLLLNLGYSFGLKNIPIVDIVILVSGFILRILYGAIVNEIEISNWLYLTVFVISLFLSLGKRRNELRKYDDTTRKVLNFYTIPFLDKSMTMCMTMANIFYALWSMEANNTTSSVGVNMVLTVPLVVLITMRYSMTIEADMDGDPVEVLLHDKILLGMCILYAVTVLALLYW